MLMYKIIIECFFELCVNIKARQVDLGEAIEVDWDYQDRSDQSQKIITEIARRNNMPTEQIFHPTIL